MFTPNPADARTREVFMALGLQEDSYGRFRFDGVVKTDVTTADGLWRLATVTFGPNRLRLAYQDADCGLACRCAAIVRIWSEWPEAELGDPHENPIVSSMIDADLERRGLML